jgi:glucosyl-dolichyl phosphate glucuronosyltransferase
MITATGTGTLKPSDKKQDFSGHFCYSFPGERVHSFNKHIEGISELFMDISVIICTFNRCESLRRTLKSFSEMVNPKGISWQLVIVDNNSKDKTRMLCEEYKQKAAWDFRYVFEGKQGLSHARNRGIIEAQGRVLAFTDDDVIVDRHWLSNIHELFQEYRVGGVGGKVLPLWETPKPKWLIQDLYGMLALLDLGDQPIYLDYPEIVFGANFAVRAEMFGKYGAFDKNLGRIGQRLSCHEELDFIHRLQKAGEKILYHPQIVVHHCISRRRLSKWYFRRWKYGAGASNAFLQKHINLIFLFKESYYRIKYNFSHYNYNLLCLSPQRFVHELEIIQYVSLLWHTFMWHIRKCCK